MSTAEAQVCRFMEAYIKSRGGEVTNQSTETFTVKYPDDTSKEYTYQPTIARERKIPLITAGSPAFQQILKEAQEKGVLCQVLLSPKENFESTIENCFRSSPYACAECNKKVTIPETGNICLKAQPCYHVINNGEIDTINIYKKEPAKYYLFYFSAVFQNKLRPKNEELITMLLDEGGTVIDDVFADDDLLENDTILIKDFQSKLKPAVFDALKAAAENTLKGILEKKLALFDLMLAQQKKSRLQSFGKRLKRERREQIISKKLDFDREKWQRNYEALLKREEESFTTNIVVRLVNLLVINTSKVKFEVLLSNRATIHSSITLGIDHACEVTCPICKQTCHEGYATEDSLYVCENCIRQSVESGKVYSKKAPLTLDAALGEYIEADGGFVCSVCGKKRSRLLEFKCSHDGSSVCIQHYGLCDVCGKVFSKLILKYTEDFQRQLCPRHATK